jgi:hypothetical protein
MLELFGDKNASAQGTSESPHERCNRLQRERRAKQREQPSFRNDALQLFRDGDASAQGTSESAHERRNCVQKKRRVKQREQPSFRNDALQLFGDEDASAPGRWDCGEMDTICGFCSAKMWIKERSANSTNNNPQFSLCCENGKVLLPNLPATPQELEVLLTSKESSAVKFRNEIRMYNSVLAFISFGAKVDDSVIGSPGPYSFRIQGELYHKIGSLCPTEGQCPQFAQLYIHDTKRERQNRHAVMPSLDPTTLDRLLTMMYNINPYVEVFKMARDMMVIEDAPMDLKLCLIAFRTKDARQYNVPTADEVAALMVGDGSKVVDKRDIVLAQQAGPLQRISELHVGYMALYYLLFFPYGEDGWHPNILINAVVANANLDEDHARKSELQRKHCNVIMAEFYGYRLQHRDTNGIALLRGDRLRQQYIVDAYVGIEQNRLKYLRLNKKKLRADLYQGLQDAIAAGDTSVAAIRQRIILPSSFIVGPRHMV